MEIRQKNIVLSVSLPSSFMGAGCAATANRFAGLGGKKQKSATAGGPVIVNTDVSQSIESQAAVDLDIDGDDDTPSGQVVRDCMVGNSRNGSFDINWKLDEACMGRH